MRIAGLCLLALGAMFAFTSSAFALPEVGRCVSKPGAGKYKTAAEAKAGVQAKMMQAMFGSIPQHQGVPMGGAPGAGGMPGGLPGAPPAGAPGQ